MDFTSVEQAKYLLIRQQSRPAGGTAVNGTKIAYWYGADEKNDRKCNIRFIRHDFPQLPLREFPNMAHAELVMIHPAEFCRYAEEFLNQEE